MLNNLAESHDSSRNAIKADLQNNIAFNDATVFKHLRVHQVDHNFVSTCTASLKANITEDIIALKNLVKPASQKTPDGLEDEERLDKAYDKNKEEKSGNHGSVEEKKMYGLLVRNILRKIFFLCSVFFISGAVVQLYSQLR
jgi:hypothetical protein